MTVVRAIPPQGEQPVVQEPEGMATKRPVLVAVVFLVIFTLATLWAVAMMRGEERQVAPRADLTTAEIGKPEIGIVNQRLFLLQLDAKEKREEQLRHLNSYGWVDRDKQVIHLPIDRAMQLLSAEPQR
jgi:hypothetical protein